MPSTNGAPLKAIRTAAAGVALWLAACAVWAERADASCAADHAAADHANADRPTAAGSQDSDAAAASADPDGASVQQGSNGETGAAASDVEDGAAPSSSKAAVPQHQTVDENLVRQVQQALFDLGYDPGPIDGAITGRTRAEIERFQRETDVAVTGEPSVDLLTQMIERLADR